MLAELRDGSVGQCGRPNQRRLSTGSEIEMSFSNLSVPMQKTGVEPEAACAWARPASVRACLVGRYGALAWQLACGMR